jgi:beta-galactosidase
VTAFTAKDHSFFAGATIRKQFALLNDRRKLQSYALRWSATLNRKIIAKGEKNGRLAVGQTLLVPFEFAAPGAPSKMDGGIALNATIGAEKHSDRFNFRVWPRAVVSKGSVTAFNPEGKTTAMLRGLGYTLSPWKVQRNPHLLVIGRNALKNGVKFPGDLKGFVQGGGRVLLSGHDPHWLRENLGMRVSYHQSRRVFPVGNNAATSGLDAFDLRDWRGQSTLFNPRPDYLNGKGPDVRISRTQYPYAGWRWAREARSPLRLLKSRTALAGGRCSKPSSTWLIRLSWNSITAWAKLCGANSIWKITRALILPRNVSQSKSSTTPSKRRWRHVLQSIT